MGLYIKLFLMLALSAIILLSFSCFCHIIEKQQTPLCNDLSDISKVITPIYSFESDKAIYGSFFLGSGYIETRPVYVFYTGNDVNGFSRKMIDSNNVILFRDSESPYMVEKLHYQMMLIDELTGIKSCRPTTIIELHVPKGTLIKEVKL